MASAGELAVLIKALEQTYTAQLNIAAATAWLSYDILITVQQEVERMWFTKFSAPFVMFFVCRYYGLFVLIYSTAVQTNYKLSDKFCRGWGPFESFSVQFMSMIVNALLALRVHAFYNRNKIVLGLLLLFYFGETVIEITLSTVTEVEAGRSAAAPPGIPLAGCEEHSYPRFALAAWVTNVVYQVLLFIMVVFKFFKTWKTEHISPPLAGLFVRDGLLFFFMMFAANLVNVFAAFATHGSPIIEIGVPWLIGSFSVAASRIILSLRGARNPSGYTEEFELPSVARPVAFPPSRYNQNESVTMFSETVDIAADTHGDHPRASTLESMDSQWIA